MREDLRDILNRGEGLLIFGDMNVAVGSDEYGVAGNNERVSYGGELVREFIKENNLSILNNLAEGGPWTWVQRGKDWIRSCLDLAICSPNLLPFVNKMVIDKDKQFTPRRVIWRKNKCSAVFTDHFPIELVFSNMPRRKTICVKSSTWNLGKPEGWKTYEELTEKAAIHWEYFQDERGSQWAKEK